MKFKIYLHQQWLFFFFYFLLIFVSETAGLELAWLKQCLGESKVFVKQGGGLAHVLSTNLRPSRRIKKTPAKVIARQVR